MADEYDAALGQVFTKAKRGDLSAFKKAIAVYAQLVSSSALAMTLRGAAEAAASAGHADIVLYLCRSRGVLVNAFADDEDPSSHNPFIIASPLSIAIAAGHEELALQLLAIPQSPGKDPTRRPCQVTTADFSILHWAGYWNRVRVVEALMMEHGMDMNAQDGQSHTPLDVSVLQGSVASARFLLQKQREVGGFEQAMNRDWPSRASRMGTFGQGGPPLVYLATYRSWRDFATDRIDQTGFDARQLSMVRLLVEEFDADVAGHCGGSAFHNSAHGGKLLLVKYFLETRGFSVHTPSTADCTMGWSPLHFACFCQGGPEKEARNLRVVEYLVGKGASLTQKASDGLDAVETAKKFGNLRIHCYLVAQRRTRRNDGERHNEEKEVDAAAEATAEAAAEAARAALLAELDAEEEKEGEKKSGGGGGGGGSKKKKKKKKGGAAAGGGGGGAVARGGGGGTGQAAAATTTAVVERSMEGLDLGNEEGQEQGRAAAKAEADAEEQEEEAEDPGHVDTIQDEESFILEGAPNEFFCPITTALLVNPCVAGDGIVYEEEAIHQWFATCRSKGNPITSPKLGCVMEANTMRIATHKTLIKDFVDKRKQEWKRLCAEREAGKKKKGKK